MTNTWSLVIGIWSFSAVIPMIRVYIALGSNLGDRQRYLDAAVARLHAAIGLTVRGKSPYYETAAVGGPADSPAYLNAVVEADTILSPEQLLQTLLDVERSFGRIRGEPNAPRTLDLDLLLYGDLVRHGHDPIVPHPRMHERQFVLQPLADLASDLVHPTIKKSIRELLDGLPPDADPPRVFPVEPPKNTDELLGLRALVTGSTSGIGRAIALELARAGADVIVHGRRSSEAATDLSHKLAECRGRRSTVLMADLADPAACERLVGEAWNVWNGLDIFIQNAGADVVTGDAADWSFEQKWEALVAVDMTATLRLCRSLGERMKAGRGGVILTVGWDQAETGFDAESGLLFAPAKGAVMAFTRTVGASHRARLRVNCLAPGWIKTAWGETASDRWQQRVASETPLKRWGLPEDVAATARWLCSPAAAFITGQIVRVNGGVV
jgi:2-amino-4-hydroxy-6-hydroxymethyldihydropteridine diphosphokinase